MEALVPFVPVLVAIATGVMGIVGGFVAWVLKRIEDVHKNTTAAKDQVTNDHKTNLRDDIDGLVTASRDIRTVQEQQGRLIQSIHDDLAHERRERLALAGRLDSHLAVNASDVSSDAVGR